MTSRICLRGTSSDEETLAASVMNLHDCIDSYSLTHRGMAVVEEQCTVVIRGRAS